MHRREICWRSACALATLVAALAIAVGPAAAAPRLIWSNSGANGIDSIDLAGGASTFADVATPTSPDGTAVDAAAGRVYWGSYTGTCDDAIHWTSLDGSDSGVLAIGSATASCVVGLALDPATHILYWANDSSDDIEWAKTDGSGGGVLYSAGAGAHHTDAMHDPLSPVVVPSQHRIYWANYGSTTVGYANLDGSGGSGEITPTCAVSEQQVHTVLVDAATSTLYLFGWRSSGIDVADLQRMHLDGSDCETLITGVSTAGVFGATLDSSSGRLYWGDDVANAMTWVDVANPTSTGTVALGSHSVNAPYYPALIGAPRATSPATLTASGRAVGATLTCGDATWDALGDPGLNVADAPTPARDRTWERDGATIAGATGSTLTATAAGRYTCTVAASNGGGRSESVSNAIVVRASSPWHVRWRWASPISSGRFAAVAGTTYRIRATRVGTAASIRGTCVVAGARGRCHVRLTPGRWRVAITPYRGGVAGQPRTTVVRVRSTPDPVAG